jgi:hypothetical protein
LLHRLTGNHYRDFLSHDLPKLPEAVPLAVRARVWCMRDAASAQFSLAVRDIPSNTRHDPPDSNPLDIYLWGRLNTLALAAPVDNEETLHHRTVDACQSMRNCPAISERTRRSVSRTALNLMVDILGTFYKCTHKLNVFGHMLTWTFLVCGTRAKILSTPSVTSCIYIYVYVCMYIHWTRQFCCSPFRKAVSDLWTPLKGVLRVQAVRQYSIQGRCYTGARWSRALWVS